MKKLLFAAATALLIGAPSFAVDPAVKGWKTNDSLGCMMLRECLDDVSPISSTADLETYLRYSNFDSVREETDAIIDQLNLMGVNVYLASDKYFPRGHAGVYSTVSNDFFLNDSYADDPIQMLRTLRHEAFHAAQDAFAGSIDNTQIAIIHAEEDVPQQYQLAAEIAYGNSPVLPWEKEAKWAGGTPNLTLNILRIINETNGKPWTVIEPTPMTREWLEMKGYM
jgi:hypothetical protein